MATSRASPNPAVVGNLQCRSYGLLPCRQVLLLPLLLRRGPPWRRQARQPFPTCPSPTPLIDPRRAPQLSLGTESPWRSSAASVAGSCHSRRAHLRRRGLLQLDAEAEHEVKRGLFIADARQGFPGVDRGYRRAIGDSWTR
ncbi:hypothetical protein PVAP13_8NG251604 [Panicum virgatum]|uniref:Uncharacterized protein n=1 Tax=Panicum virgatum TaxID=38727 RepID=A0A8T0P9K8_PANVG|nr:hypothetical protein PVAP13_8NG251604 [Panicum virgatum]